MGKDPLSGALSRSLQDEDTAVEQRFARADSILGGQGKQRAVLPATPAPPSKERAVRATFTLAEADSELLPALQQRCLERTAQRCEKRDRSRGPACTRSDAGERISSSGERRREAQARPGQEGAVIV